MPVWPSLITFCVAALLLNIAPGPDMLYVIGRSVGQGRKAGIVSSLGIGVGCLFHVAAAGIGLAALLRSSPVAYHVVRYAGAAYLIYLAIKILTDRSNALATPDVAPEPMSAIFRQGVITNILNPKVALFFVAFLPQFTDPSRGPVALQILVLGLWFDLGGTLVNLAVAYAGGSLGDSIRRMPRVARFQQWLTGVVFLGLGFRLAFSRK